MSRILLVDSSLRTWLCRSHLLTHTSSGTLIFCTNTPSGSGSDSCSSSCSRSKANLNLATRRCTSACRSRRTRAL